MALIEMAKLNGLDPQAWLRDALDRIADHPNTGWRTAAVDPVARSARSRSGVNDLRALPSAYPEDLVRS